jgi:pimeloyl-ACP methyl ester carboxylesterase
VRSGRLSPRLFGLFMQQMRLRAVRRLPLAFGHLTRRGDAATARWMRPVLSRPEIRRDTVRVLRAAAADPDILVAAAEHLPKFARPALVVWATDDSDTLIPLDRPARLAELIRAFTRKPT